MAGGKMIGRVFAMSVPSRPPGSPLPKGEMWLPHRALKHRRRHMRQRAAAIMRSKDPATVATRERLEAVADGMPDDPYEELYPIICETLCTAEEEGHTWAEVAARVVSAFEENETANDVEEIA